MRNGGVTDLLFAESIEVRAEMVRLREAHNILGYALRMAVKDKLGPDAGWDKVDAETVEWIKRSTAELAA